MESYWLVLVQFAARFTLGVAAAMAITSPRLVTSGFFRVHLWVLMGVQTFAALVVSSSSPVHSQPAVFSSSALVGLFAGLAFACYVGAVVWMYEAYTAGRIVLGLVGLGALTEALAFIPLSAGISLANGLWIADAVSAAALLGFTTTAMFLGHWYLNTPSMKLGPLRVLIVGMAMAAGLRALVAGAALACQVRAGADYDFLATVFLALRWLTGIASPLAMAGLAWQTLKIPNTQSATGILYAAVTLVFSGELTAQMLSAGQAFPV